MASCIKLSFAHLSSSFLRGDDRERGERIRILKSLGVNRHVSSPFRQIKERSAGANPFRSRERGETLQSPTLERTEKTKGEKVSATRGRLQPLCQVYTARYLSRVCLKKCAAAETCIRVIALRRLLRSGNTLKSVRIFSSLKTRLGKVMLNKCIDKMRTYACIRQECQTWILCYISIERLNLFFVNFSNFVESLVKSFSLLFLIFY